MRFNQYTWNLYKIPQKEKPLYPAFLIEKNGLKRADIREIQSKIER